MLNKSKKEVNMQDLTIETIKKCADYKKSHLNLISYCLNFALLEQDFDIRFWICFISKKKL